MLKDKEYLLKERQRFAFNLRQLKKMTVNIIYFDESTFNTFSVQRRAWGLHDEAYQVTPKKRVSTAIYCALGNCFDRPVIQFYDRSNADAVVDFW